MSGMFDTKTDKASRKLAVTQKEAKAKRKSRIISISVISVLIVFSAAAILINSGFIRRTVPVVTIDGVNFNAAEIEYYFNSEYMEYINMMSQFQGMGMSLPEAGRPLSGQIYNHETGETWADVILSSTLSRLVTMVNLYNAATASGFTLSDERLADIEAELSMVEMQAVFNDFPSTNSLLQQMYGSSMNVDVYRKIMNFTTVAWSYNEHVRESFTYSSTELDNFYLENKNDLDVFSFRMLFVAAAEHDYSDFDSDEAYEKATETAIAEAYERAENIILGGIDSAEAFIALAQVEAGFASEWVGAVQNIMGEELDENIAEWFLDETRRYGDIVQFNESTGSTIMYFVGRDNNNYHTVGMRQILMLRDDVNSEDFAEGIFDPGYIEAVEQAERDLHARAEQVNALFTATGETEDALIGLMSDHSDDTTPGGEYTNIAKHSYQSSHLSVMKVVPEIEDWLFAENRAVSDTELVYTEAYGYHLLYFTGFGELLFELMADDRMRTRDHSEWSQSLVPGVPVKRTAFILVHM